MKLMAFYLFVIFCKISDCDISFDYCSIKCQSENGEQYHTLCKYNNGPSKNCKEFTSSQLDENYKNELLREMNKVNSISKSRYFLINHFRISDIFYIEVLFLIYRFKKSIVKYLKLITINCIFIIMILTGL